MAIKKKQSNLVICEAHQVIDASHELSLSEIRLIQIFLANTFQGEVWDEEKFYKLDVSAYAKEYEITTDAAYNALLDACKLLMTRTITLKTKLLDNKASDSRKTVIHWVDRLEYNPTTSQVELRWHRDIVPLLSNLGADAHYSSYYFENTRLMSSLHSIRLFRLVNKWAKAGKLKLNLVEFRRLMGLKDDSYPVFNDLKEDVVNPAVKDICKFTDLRITVEFLPLGRGKKKLDVQFNIGKKNKIPEISMARAEPGQRKAYRKEGDIC